MGKKTNLLVGIHLCSLYPYFSQSSYIISSTNTKGLYDDGVVTAHSKWRRWKLFYGGVVALSAQKEWDTLRELSAFLPWCRYGFRTHALSLQLWEGLGFGGVSSVMRKLQSSSLAWSCHRKQWAYVWTRAQSASGADRMLRPREWCRTAAISRRSSRSRRRETICRAPSHLSRSWKRD